MRIRPLDITWYGHSCFRIIERGQITIITDPYSETIGLPALKLKGDVVTISHDVPGHNYADAVKTRSRTISGPGEYEIGGVFIEGVSMPYILEETARQNVAYLFHYDSLKVLHLGDLAHVPDQSTMERFGEVNVLMVPVGGGNSLKAGEAADVVALIEPHFVIPMHYEMPGLAFELEPVDKFLKAMGVSKVQEADTLKVTLSDMPEQPQVVVLKPQV
jgi:L-ascorbate metabolism protein UlaG (beta-lactamase superfamily)